MLDLGFERPNLRPSTPRKIIEVLKPRSEELAATLTSWENQEKHEGQSSNDDASGEGSPTEPGSVVNRFEEEDPRFAVDRGSRRRSALRRAGLPEYAASSDKSCLYVKCVCVFILGVF